MAFLTMETSSSGGAVSGIASTWRFTCYLRDSRYARGSASSPPQSARLTRNLSPKTCPRAVALTGQATRVCCIAQRAAAARVETPILP
jgi:hypothetical protein